MKENLIQYQNILSSHGIKNTRQKKLILLELIDATSHLTAEELYQKLKEEKVGLATVYRSLKVFTNLGIVKEIPMDGLNYYELRIFSKKPLHIHFKCTNCNVMIDIDDSDINLDYIKLNQKVEMKRGFAVKDSNIVLLGLCKKCKEKLESKKMLENN
ncbi:Fur family transcriptional regulator [Anaerosacchariphilus polymeriproducens]|uniref:Transcriptional repressor n=1 Tax=Anaerosacchariphilus polymeriproducens TaxID=1812858 RepID=A0A371B052_9FIRM|nr:Fur family transcriptional regulator [Anaerosacchariphilus polymeriproducens]RDU25122.1 transcriptional repressor [Anaerosacchariphilus polymeriproducens]